MLAPRADHPPHPVLERLGGASWLLPLMPPARDQGLAAHLGGKEPWDDEEDDIDRLAKGMKRTTLRQQERMVEKCRQCSAREPLKKLFKCSGCQYAYYWCAFSISTRRRLLTSTCSSKECQKTNWRLHR